MTDNFVGAIVLFSAIAVLLVLVDRSRVIAVCEVKGGTLRVTRGRLSPRVLFELRDVVTRMRLSGAKITVRKERGMPKLLLRGVNHPAAEQQFRNVIGRFKLAELR